MHSEKVPNPNLAFSNGLNKNSNAKVEPSRSAGVVDEDAHVAALHGGRHPRHPAPRVVPGDGEVERHAPHGRPEKAEQRTRAEGKRQTGGEGMEQGRARRRR